MKTGNWVNFYLPFRDNGQTISAKSQALKILQTSIELLKKGAKGVAITYSANYGQTREIQRCYFSGTWITAISGANQAAVMSEMEQLLNSSHEKLQGGVQVLPITTMNAYEDPIEPWNADVLLGIVMTDLDRVKAYLESGWTVLGWQNQNTHHNPSHPYAVGGGVSQLPQFIDDKIQACLIEYSQQYG